MADVALDQPKILLLGGAKAKTTSLESLLDSHGDVQVVETCQQALEAIQSGHIDLVVGEAGDFLTGQCAQCARWVRHALGTANEAVAAMDLEGDVLWADAATATMPDSVMGAVADACRDITEEWRATQETQPLRGRVVRRFHISDLGEESDYEVAVSPVLNPEGTLIQLAVLIRDVTATAGFQRRLKDVEQAGRQLSRIDAEQFIQLEAPQRVARVEEQISSHAHNVMNFHRFSIRLLDREKQRLNVAMAEGMSDEIYRRNVCVATERNGICGYVAATNRSYLCPDTDVDPLYLRGSGGGKSSLTVPLRLHDEVVGVFNVESDEYAAFNDLDRQMLEAFGRHVARALYILDLLVIERYHTTGRLADDVSSEIAGPLNDIASDAAALLEQYIGDDAMRERLTTIRDSVEKIRNAVQQVARPTNGLKGEVNGHAAVDPLLVGKRLLVADDEDVIRDTLYEVLSGQGCYVDTARDGEQAIHLLGQSAYDLVLADIRMPYRNGYEVFSAVKDRSPNSPVILITGFGYDPNHSIVKARQEGLAAVLFKPFKVDELLDEVRQALAHATTN